MDPKYKALQQQADRLQYKMNDWIDDKGHPLGAALIKESREVREDLESNKPPRSVEDRVKRLIQHLRQDSPAISPEHAQSMENDYEDLRRSLRELPNY